jgi:Coenzyme F420-reducing hydrogenase, beta subunit
MVDQLVKKDICTGCYACFNICDKKAITMNPDKEGFKYPEVKANLCNQCGSCVSVCPSLKENYSNDKKPSEIYAAWSLDDEIRSLSTSGGIFSELAIEILEAGGYICGAVYNEQFLVEHMVSDNKEGLARIRQSKYVQSDMNDVYRKIRKLLVQNKSVLFCGSPCECAGLKSYLSSTECATHNLILIDFVCRGANSPKVYMEFLKEMEKKYSSDIQRVWFKNKTYGWNRFSTKIEFKDGQNYLEDRFHDLYIRGYVEENLFIRPVCSECRYKGLPKIADITLADFWGIKLEKDNHRTDGGTSLVIINSERGEELFDRIKSKIFFEKKHIDDAVPGNMCIYHSIKHGEHREKFMSDLDQINIVDNLSRFLKNTSADDMADLNKFIDKNSTVELSHIEKIPVNYVTQYKWVGGIKYHNFLYGIPGGADAVLKVDLLSNQVLYLGSLGYDEFKWTGGGVYKDRLFGFMRASNNLLVIDPIEDKISQVELGLKYTGEHHYGGVITEQGLIYQPPRNTDHILVTDLNTFTTRRINLNISNPQVRFRYCGSVLHSNGLIYFLPEVGQKVLVLDPKSEKYQFIGEELQAMVFNAAVARDGNIYGFSAYEKGILKIDVKNNKTDMICKSVGIPGCFGTKLGINGKFYGIPGDGNSIYEFDPVTSQIIKIASISEAGKAKCAGGIIEKDGTIVCVPALGKYIYKFVFKGINESIPDNLKFSCYFNDYY